MIKTTMTIKSDDEGDDNLGIVFNRIVHIVGGKEQICMDLRTIAHGIRKRIKEEAKNKEDEVALQTMYETAFLEGFRMSGKEIENLDQELYDQILGRLVADEETKGTIYS